MCSIKGSRFSTHKARKELRSPGETRLEEIEDKVSFDKLIHMINPEEVTEIMTFITKRNIVI